MKDRIINVSTLTQIAAFADGFITHVQQQMSAPNLLRVLSTDDPRKAVHEWRRNLDDQLERFEVLFDQPILVSEEIREATDEERKRFEHLDDNPDYKKLN